MYYKAIDQVPSEPLATRTQNHLLEAIGEGRWSNGLPAERQLATAIGVSRPVLREALLKLQDLGYVKRGKGRRLFPTGAKQPGELLKSALIVHSSTESSMPASTRVMLKLTSEQLSKKQIAVLSATCPALRAEDVADELADLHNQYPKEVWLLRSPSAAALEWCESNHPRCVVLGAQPSPASFAGVDLDIDAIFTHCLKLCKQQQRQQVVFLVPPGKSHAVTKLEDFLTNFYEPTLTTHIERIPNRDTAQSKRQILHLLSAQPRPNAFVCNSFQHWLLMYSVLNEAQMSPLKDVLLLCHYPDPLMDWVSHGVAHYSFEWEQAAAYLAKNIEQALYSIAKDEVLFLQPYFVPAY